MQRSKSIWSAVAVTTLVALGAATGTSPAEARAAKNTPRGRDTTAPTLVVPADITTDAIAPMGRAVAWTATATDDKDPSPVVVSSPASGSAFPVGTTTVTVTATDWKGNTTTATFDVTVTPMTGPVAYKEHWVGADGYSWYEWDITVSPDGTVSGVGLQTNLIVVDFDTWFWPYGYVCPLPSALSGSGFVSGTISSDGTCELTSSHNYWYQNMFSDDVDESGNPIFREDTGGFSGSMTASLRNGGLVFSGSPLDAPDYSEGLQVGA